MFNIIAIILFSLGISIIIGYLLVNLIYKSKDNKDDFSNNIDE